MQVAYILRIKDKFYDKKLDQAFYEVEVLGASSKVQESKAETGRVHKPSPPQGKGRL